jgi:hypothetical protein
VLTKETGTFTFNVRQGVGQTYPAETVPAIGDTSAMVISGWFMGSRGSNTTVDLISKTKRDSFVPRDRL